MTFVGTVQLLPFWLVEHPCFVEVRGKDNRENVPDPGSQHLPAQ